MRAARLLASLAAIAGLLLTSGAAATCLAQAAAEPAHPADGARILSNADVVQMLRSGFSDRAVIAVVQRSVTRFDLSSASLAELRYAGVSDSVIVAMLDSENAAAVAPATPAPAPTPAAPSPAPAVAPRPATPPRPRPLESVGDEKKDAPRSGAVFGLTLGGHYVRVLDDGRDEDSFEDQDLGDDEPRFGASLGLQVGGHVGRRTVLLADIHAALWPETEKYASGGLFSLGPAVRFSPLPRLSFEAGLSLALAMPDWDDFTNDEPWLGPAGHLGLGVELTSGRSSFALELLARVDLARLSRSDCDSCEAATLGWVTTQLALTWY